MAIPQVTANKVLDHLHAVATFAALTGPIKQKLTTSASTATAQGTEVSGGSYTAGGSSVTFGAAASGTSSNSTAVTYTNMPVATTTGIVLTDSAGTPIWTEYGALTASKTTAAGDTLSFAIAAVTDALN